MREFEPHESTEKPLGETVRQAFRILTACFGVLLMLAGLCFAFQLFGVAYAAATSPERFGGVIEQWAGFLGGNEPVLKAGQEFQVSSRLAAALVFGGSLVVLLWLTLAVISTGARIVYWMGTDLDSVKQVLSKVFGPATIQVVKAPEAKPPKPLSVPPRDEK